MSLSLYFLSPVQLRRGSERAALVGTWHPARVNPPQPQVPKTNMGPSPWGCFPLHSWDSRGTSQKGMCCLFAGWMFRGPQGYLHAGHTCHSFPCITAKSYFQFLCGHHIPVLPPHYAPRRKFSELYLQSAKWLTGKPSCEVHSLLPQLPLNVSGSALLTVTLVQDGRISSVS